MKKKLLLVLIAVAAFMVACDQAQETNNEPTEEKKVAEATPISFDNAFAVREPEAGEEFFGNIHQITNGGENAEAYFNAAGDKLIYQVASEGEKCDQIYMMNIDGTGIEKVSLEGGRTTCSFIGGDNEFLIYASTHELGEHSCSDIPTRGRDYAWMLFDYEIYKRNMDGSGLVNLTNSPGYDAEGIVSPDGKSIIFSSTRTGDQDIFIMDTNGENLRQLTDSVGYDGGPFYSWDGTKIVYRSYHPKSDAEIASYKKAISENKMLRVPLEIFVMNADGTGHTQVTELGASSFAPFMHPNGEQIIFCSNYNSPRPFIFNLWMVNVDGTGLKQVTNFSGFNGFPMFSKDGKYLVFISNRHAEADNHQNIFVAEWK